jgi:hypothetical protein
VQRDATSSQEDVIKWLKDRCIEIQMASDGKKSRKSYLLLKKINGNWNHQKRAKMQRRNIVTG